MTKRVRYPRLSIVTVPPDPRRKSAHVVILSQQAKHKPIDIVCFADCIRRGKAREDGSCRHTDVVLARVKPWWRARSRVAAMTATTGGQGDG